MKWNSSHKRNCLFPEQILVYMTEVETFILPCSIACSRSLQRAGFHHKEIRCRNFFCIARCEFKLCGSLVCGISCRNELYLSN